MFASLYEHLLLPTYLLDIFLLPSKYLLLSGVVMSPLVLMRDMTFSFLPFLTGTFIAFAFFLLAKSIYRVTFHPLAAFPGPRWAALTSLYGASYDLHPNRSYCKQFAALHDRYGLNDVLKTNHSY